MNTIGMFLKSSPGLCVEDLNKGILLILNFHFEKQLLQKVHSKMLITEFPSLRKLSDVS